ncbi:hypothetical protein DFH09DRAFT_923818, partial [Mycena vulgaris]
YHIYHDQELDITAKKRARDFGWDRVSMCWCWAALDMTSRSFSFVRRQGDLARVVCRFRSSAENTH